MTADATLLPAGSEAEPMSAPPAPARTKTQAAVTGQGSAFLRYQEVIVGSRSLGRTLYFELCLWLGSLPGALGLLLRKMLWPRLFGSCGRGVLFGSGIVLRHPHRVHLGDRVVIGEGTVLDGRGDGEEAIRLGDDVILSTGVVLSAKAASIVIGPRTGLGPLSVVVTTDGNAVEIGADVAIGPQTSLIGGGAYHTDRLDVPIWRQGIKPNHHLRIADDIWLGAGVAVLGGTTIERGSIVAAGAAVASDVKALTIVGGVPARPLRRRAPAKRPRRAAAGVPA